MKVRLAWLGVVAVILAAAIAELSGIATQRSRSSRPPSVSTNAVERDPPIASEGLEADVSASPALTR